MSGKALRVFYSLNLKKCPRRNEALNLGAMIFHQLHILTDNLNDFYRLTKFAIDKMSDRKNVMLTKCHIDKMPG